MSKDIKQNIEMDDLDSKLPEQANVMGVAPKQANSELTEDKELAALLSRLAALQGEVVSKVQLVMTQSSIHGVDLGTLRRSEKALETWRAIFPMGQASKFVAPEIDFEKLPSLWISDDEHRILILIGRLTSGAYQATDYEGNAQQLSAADVHRGQHLNLRVSLDEKTGGLKSTQIPRTARDWFRYSLLKRRHIFIEAAIATGCINILALAGSLYSMNIYDRVVPTKTLSTLWVLSIGVLIAYVFDFILRQIRARFVDSACREIDDDLSNVFFGKMLAIRMDQRPAAVGTFASQLRQFETVRNFLTSVTMFILADAPFSLLFVAVIALIAGPLAIIPLMLLPLTLGIILLRRKQFFDLSESKIKETNQRNGLLVEVISGIESVKAAQGGWKFARRWDEINRSLSANDLSIRHHSHTLMTMVQSLQQVLFITMMIAGVYEIHSGELTTGGLIACTIIGSRALAPAGALAGIISQWQTSLVALDVLEAIMLLPTDGGEDSRDHIIPETCNAHLQVESVKYFYGKDMPVSLDVARLEFKAAERVVIMGSSGSGKSTLLKVLSGLYFPTEGKVSLDGLDMANLAPGFLREHIGYLPQDVWLFEGTLRDNITIGLPSPSDAQILRAAELTGLIQIIKNHPMGMALPITEGGRGLSVGQRQLVGITRMLIAQPKILLLDEPTASMDTRLEQFVIGQLTQHIAPDSLLILVSHKPELLRYASRVLILDKGKVGIDGPRDQVLDALKAKLAAQNPSANVNAPPESA